MKTISIKQGFSLFVVASMAAMAILLVLAADSLMSSHIRGIKEQDLDNYVTELIADLNYYGDVRRLELEGTAKLPLLIQGIMQPESSLASVVDLFKDIFTQGQQPQQMLVDFAGNVVFSRYPNEPLAEFEYLQDDMTSSVELVLLGDTVHVEISIPLRYRGSVEGALVTFIPFSTVTADLGFNTRLQGLKILLTNEQGTLLNIGEGDYAFTKELDTQWLGYNVVYEADTSVIEQVVTQVKIEIIVIVLLFSIVLVIVAIQLGQKLFIRPIQSLNEKMQSFDSQTPVNSFGRIPLEELQQVLQQFEKLTQKVSKRDRQLRDANQQIQENQNQLIQSEKMASIGTLAAGIAHEINNPVGFVKSNIETLREYSEDFIAFDQTVRKMQESGKLSDKDLIAEKIKATDLTDLFKDTQEIADDCLNGLTRIEEIVQGLKTFARSDNESKTVFSIAEQLDQAAKLAWNQVKYNAELSKNVHQDFQINGFPGQINQVILNLLVNAVHTITETQIGNGTIEIEVGVRETNEGYLSVSDNGAGIDPENLTHLFTPFFTTKPPGQGTGLGLSISFEIVQKHGGRIEVESTKGEGTTFTLIFSEIESLLE